MSTALHRIVTAVAAFCLPIGFLLPEPVRAQAAPDSTNQSAAQQDLDQQMQDLRTQVFRNMIAQGIDPRDFFEEVRKASPDGSFDLDVVKQKLVEKGLLDQETIDRVQGTLQKVSTDTLKQQLKVSDDEWAALQPKIQKVVDAAYAAGVPQQQFMLMGFHPSNKGPSSVSLAMRELRAASKDSTNKPDVIAEKLEAWRAAKQQAQQQYTAAQRELIEVLTRRQEAVLMLAGLFQ